MKIPIEGLGSNALQSVATMETRELQSSFDFMVNGEHSFTKSNSLDIHDNF